MSPSNTNPVTKMYRWLGVSTAGFYDWLTRGTSTTAARRDQLTARVKNYFDACQQTYRYQRILTDLMDAATPCSPELVRQIMRDQGLVPCQPRPFRVTTQADTLAVASIPDVVHRDFSATGLGTKCVDDIPYIHTWQGCIYLATVIDCFLQEGRGLGYRGSDASIRGGGSGPPCCCHDQHRAWRDHTFGQGCSVFFRLVPGIGAASGDALIDGTDLGLLGLSG